MAKIIFPLVCPKCGSKNVDEVCDGQWSTTTFEWDEKAKKYKEQNQDIDGDGECSLKCTNCSFEYPYESYEAWLELEHLFLTSKVIIGTYNTENLFTILTEYLNNQTKEQWNKTVEKLTTEGFVDTTEMAV